MFNLYKSTAKICILLVLLLLSACVVSENPSASGYINPRYPSAMPYSYPYQQQQAYSPSPRSRYYTNPYDFPQPNYYQYYDTDRYYKPPNTYNNRATADSR